MKNIKTISLFILILSLLNFTACEKSENANTAIDLFDSEKALNVSKEYLFNIKNGNIEGANKLCSEELLSQNVNISEGISDITSFDKEKAIEGRNFGYYIYNVIRSSNIEPKSDLENFIIKVERNQDSYLINEVKAQSKKELFVIDKYLRILEDEGGNSNIVLSLDSLPKDTYSSENKIMLYKSKVPNNNFGKVCLSFTGKKVAISTVGDEMVYVCVANIEDSLTTFADESNSATGNSSSDMSQLEELLEKPIAKKIISLDLLKNCNINNFIFSKKEDSLAVIYTNGAGVKRINLYNANEGDMISRELDEEFNADEYNIAEVGFNSQEFIFNVTRVNTENGERDKEGKYSFNVESHEINKL